MASVAVIGEPLRIHLYGLTGAMLCPATDQAEAVLAWRDMPDDVEVAVLTPNAARWLASEIARRPGVLPVLLPQTAAGRPMFWPEFLPRPSSPDPGSLPDPGSPQGSGIRPEPGHQRDAVKPPDGGLTVDPPPPG